MSTTTTVTENQSLQSFQGTCTAKFMKDGSEVAPAFNGSFFRIEYRSLFPKKISSIHFNDIIEGGRYFNLIIEPERGDGTYTIQLTDSNANFIYGRLGFIVDEGELMITVDKGNCSGTFSLTATGQPSGGEKETLNIVEGIFDIEAR
ncbi:hypothetical protein [Pseudomonas svalbardensis]|uniref:hypothetical protein n=1 Tax=Pseudomonas svalbardensis TaxID=3042029 RepID=UPI0024B3590B|nr:hypothetical protein [Pseudomonas sp. PMCC200367]